MEHAFRVRSSESKPHLTMASTDLAEWYYTDGSGTFGPFHAAVVRQLIGAGVIRSNYMLWRQGSDGWIPLGQFDAAVPPSLPDIPSSRPQAAVTRPGPPLHPRAIQPVTPDREVSKSENPFAAAGMVIALLAIVALGIMFWSGRPELFVIVLVGALIKFAISETKRR
jgi:hypothetical protein